IYEVDLVEKDQIPKTGSGKVRKKESLKRYKENQYTIMYKFCKADRYDLKEIPANNKEHNIMKVLKQKVFGEVLELNSEVIEEAESISELNINSIQNIQIAKKISSIFDTEFEPYMMYQFSDFSQLEDYLCKSVNVKAEVNEDTGITESKINKENKQVIQSDINENDIAIIGISCNFPGEADTPEKFWDNIVKGRDCISEVEKERPCIIEDYYNHNQADEYYPKFGGFIKDVDKFDASFFGISRIEAESMDPQQRKVMEMTWNVIEDSGYNPQSLAGEQIGVYLGVHNNDYSELLLDDEDTMEQYGGYADSGVHMSLIANRISRMFDFHGPSEIVNTA
ncbi:beta-ketoacyl synthase N-terminal-like domain-containing protein, partial [Clostridium beijerinckii]